MRSVYFVTLLFFSTVSLFAVPYTSKGVAAEGATETERRDASEDSAEKTVTVIFDNQDQLMGVAYKGMLLLTTAAAEFSNVTYAKMYEAIPGLKAFIIDTATVAMPLANFHMQDADQATKLSVREGFKFVAVTLKALTSAPKDKGGDRWGFEDVFVNGVKLPIRWTAAIYYLSQQGPLVSDDPTTAYDTVRQKGLEAFISLPEGHKHKSEPVQTASEPTDVKSAKSKTGDALAKKQIGEALKWGGEIAEGVSRFLMAAKAEKTKLAKLAQKNNQTDAYANLALPVFVAEYGYNNPDKALKWGATLVLDMKAKKVATILVDASYPYLKSLLHVAEWQKFLQKHKMAFYAVLTMGVVAAPFVAPAAASYVALSTMLPMLATAAATTVAAHPFVAGGALGLASSAVYYQYGDQIQEKLPNYFWGMDWVESAVNFAVVAFSARRFDTSYFDGVTKMLVYWPEYAIETFCYSTPVQAGFKVSAYYMDEYGYPYVIKPAYAFGKHSYWAATTATGKGDFFDRLFLIGPYNENDDDCGS
jgi:hypothetical protein